MAHYETVLHLIRYKNWHTEALFDRKFKLVCSELNGRYISNDFKVEVRAGSSTVSAPPDCRGGVTVVQSPRRWLVVQGVMRMWMRAV